MGNYNVLSTKNFKKLCNELNIVTISEKYISDIRKIEDSAKSKVDSASQRMILTMITVKVPDLYDAYNRYYQLRTDGISTKTQDSISYIFGKDFLESVNLLISNRYKTAFRKGMTVEEAFITRNKDFSNNGVYYNQMTDKQKKRLSLLLSVYTPERLEFYKKTISFFIKLDLTNYAGRMKRLMKLGSSTSLYASVLRYGKSVGKSTHSSVSAVKRNYLPTSIQYWMAKGFDEDTALVKINEHQQKASAMSSKKLKGTSEYSVRSVAYWIKNGYSEEEAKGKVSNIQNTWKNVSQEERDRRIELWMTTMSLKTDEEKSLINLKKTHSPEGIMARTNCDYDIAFKQSVDFFKKRNNSSKVSQELFWGIAEDIDTDGVYFSELNYEYPVMGKIVDFYDSKSKTVIEFYGNFWHADSTYTDDTLIYGKTAKEIRESDIYRETLIRSSDLVSDFIVVWEKDFRKNPKETIKNLVNILNNKRKF
ncbi:hypothetical protein [Pseudomonas phage vB_Pa-PAC2]